ncbi:hypothetical protein [Streptomyces rubiginosohelvolus]|uniref:hypothetical protein n=1 Tax=Streptomyces rubiginosohelvolus TaxID=67362 RepID=UPI0033A9931E
MKLKTRKEANGTYSWKLVTSDYPGSWNPTKAQTPWGARVQGAPFLAAEKEAAEWMAAKGKSFGKGWMPTDVTLEG